MPKYMLKRGEKHRMRYTGGGSGTKLLVGPAEVELSHAQAHAIRDKLEPLNMPRELTNAKTAEEVAVALTPKNEAESLELKHMGGGKYNVLHPETGEAINDTLLTKSQAEALVLSEGTDGQNDDE